MELKENMGILTVFLLLLCSIQGFATCLDYEREAEGPCRQTNVAPNLNTTWVQSTDFPYIVAGSKYHLYRLLNTSNAAEKDIPEYKFYYEACLKASIDKDTGTGALLSFGGNAARNQQFRMSPVGPGTTDFTEVNNARGTTGNTGRYTVTLTDNKSFVFFSICWLKTDQRGWDLLSTKPVLGEEEVALIEEHAVSLGFNRKQFVFLKCVN